MPYCVGVKTVSNLFLIGSIATSVLLLVFTSPVRGVADNVQVMVCPTAGQSSFTVTQPQSDSIISEPKLSINGSVEHISQIDFFIDDVYNHTVALGYSATEFASTVSLDPGTHTIKLVASDSCSQTTHEYSLVVTYEPKTPPSTGEGVDTEIDGRVTHGDDVPMATPRTVEKNSIEKVIERFITPQYEVAREAIGMGGSDDATDSKVQAGNVARSVLFVAGAVMALSAVHIGSLSASVLPDKIVSLLPFRRRAMTAIALVGVSLMMLVFIV